MPRRSLQNLAKAARQARSGDVAAQPKGVQRDVGVFARAIGVTPETFYGWAPSTRLKYIRAAEQGRTAAQERARVRTVRAVKSAKKRSMGPERPTGVKADPRWARVRYLQREMEIEGLNTTPGPETGVDRLGYEDLYSSESLVAHITTYGYPYVLDRMEQQYRAIREFNTQGELRATIGQDEFRGRFGHLTRRDFAASDAVADDDERWYWYHANSLHFDMS